jgi:transcription elongation factor S-II
VSCALITASNQESKAGLAVGKLRSHADKQVSDLAKEIVKKWKTEVDKHKRSPGQSIQGPSKAVASDSSSVIPSSSSNSNANNSPKPDLRTAKSDGISTSWTGDNTRDKCAALIYDALASDSGARVSCFPLLKTLINISVSE